MIEAIMPYDSGEQHMFECNLVLSYGDDKGNTREETVLAGKECEYYRIKSVPIHLSNLALYDLIAVREAEGAAYFEKIEDSGHSVIQMIVLDQEQIVHIESFLEEFGCMWHRDDEKYLIAFDVPKLVAYPNREVSYQAIKNWLDQGEREQRWGYREACLSEEWRQTIGPKISQSPPGI